MSKFIIILFIFFYFVSHSQNTFNPQNAREGEKIEYCHQHSRLESLRTNSPEVYQQIKSDQQLLNEITRNYAEAKSGVVYTIPIVFHVLHNGGAENISDAQIKDAVRILNEDFRKLNSSVNSVLPAFQGISADIEIEFKLATIAPNGTCFNGITRTQSVLSENGNNGDAQLTAALYGNNVYQGIWPHNNYLNVLVAKDVGGAAGYTQYPNNSDIYNNSIWIIDTYLGSIGTSTLFTSGTLTHEVGHWLNLMHTWGDSNEPGVPSNCNEDDEVADTPNTIGSTSCNLGENSCGPLANVENFMEYSYCEKMFTQGQATRMRAAITSNVGGRNNLWSTSNLNEVGAIANPPLCKAEFNTIKTIVCPGESIQFTDESYNSVSTWSWSFQGGSPSTSNIQNPTVTYHAPGTYEVSLTVNNGGASLTETKSAFITVLSTGVSLPFFEGFEDYNTLADSHNKWSVENPGNNAKFEVTNTAGRTGYKSVKLQNFGETGTNIDALVSSTIDLSNESINDVTLSFRYAYRKKTTENADMLRILFSSDCGDNWIFRRSIGALTMSSNIIETTNWTPTSSDWKTVHIPFNSIAFNQYFVSNFRYKFEFNGKVGNNFYIDDINIYNGPESDELVLGIDKKESLNNFTLYPNPNNGEMNVSFSLESNETVIINTIDLSGKILQSSKIQGQIGDNIILLDYPNFKPGMYFIEINILNQKQTLPFVKK